MPMIAYDEDVSFGDVLDDDEIRTCTDQDELLGWLADTDAAVEDIKAQIAGSALGGFAERAWVYRASKAMGFMSRANSRIRSRLLQLGWEPPKAKRDLAEAEGRLAKMAALNAVANEFYRLCTEGGIRDRELYHRLEDQAVALVKAREEKRATRHASFQPQVV